jgi:hypothetical protein
VALFELVQQEWKRGERRVAETPPARRVAVDRVVDEIAAELRRRLGSSFTVDELVELYDRGTSWCMEVAYAVAPGAPWAWDPQTTADAAFSRYVREAQDYAGGRRVVPED